MQLPVLYRQRWAGGGAVMWYVGSYFHIRGILKVVFGVPCSMDCWYLCKKRWR